MTIVSFDATSKERRAIRRIVDRAEQLGLVDDRTSSLMDITATHANGCPLDLLKFLRAEDFDFVHDFCGIARHLDRETGRLGHHFRPRYAVKGGTA